MWWWLAGGASAIPAADLETLGATVFDRTGQWIQVRPAAERGVVGGQLVDGGHDNVVALAGLDPGTGEAFVFCSASQIADDWALTAAHCVLGASDVKGYGMELNVLYGDDISSYGYTDAVPWGESYYNPAYNASQVTNDSGLVQLAEPRPDVIWTVLNDAPMDDSWIGVELTFYGYGITRDFGTDGGIKRTTTVPVSIVEPTVVTTYLAGTNVCNGDSGGPSTWEGPDGPEQAGVNSYVSPACVGGSAGSTRVDSQIGWIQGYVPGVALDYADLPVVEDPDGGDGAGRDWLDFGVGDDVAGLGGRWPERAGGTTHGCSATGGPVGSWLVLALLVAGTRPRGPFPPRSTGWR